MDVTIELKPFESTLEPVECPAFNWANYKWERATDSEDFELSFLSVISS